MSGEAPAGPGTLRTLRLLLGTARRRGKARRLRQRALIRQRSPLGGGNCVTLTSTGMTRAGQRSTSPNSSDIGTMTAAAGSAPQISSW